MYVRKAMNINSNATSAIVDSLFRLVRGWIGTARTGRCKASGFLLERLESRLLFMLLDRSRGAVSVLSADRLIGLRGADAPRTSLLVLVNQNMKLIVM